MSQVLDAEVRAMLSLLDDDDRAVFDAVSQKLLQIALSDRPEAAEVLRQMVEKKNAAPERVSKRIGELIDKAQFQKLSAPFRRALLENAPLEEFVFLIAQIGYPDISLRKYREELGRVESVVRLEYAAAQLESEMDKVQILTAVLFEREGYTGNTAAYFEPDNSYINRVMDRKLGIPISLGAIYLILAHRLNLPVYGVNMPAHFMLKYERFNQEYFIDPFNQGRLLNKEDCLRFLMNAGYGYVEQYLARATNMEIAERMLNNLRNSYHELNLTAQRQMIENYLMLIYEFRGESGTVLFAAPPEPDMPDEDDEE
jgi:regulator of sirC expression with transglutaminase-like and TPR domain